MWYARAADLGSAEGLYSLGWAVWRGVGARPDRALAAQLIYRWVGTDCQPAQCIKVFV